MSIINLDHGMGQIKSYQRIELINPNQGMGLIKSSQDIE